VGSLSISLALCELGSRILYRRGPESSAASLGYRYDRELGWFPVPNSRKQITASRTITAVHNSQGFRAPEPHKNSKPGVLFLGDSLVWGFDVEADERFTEKLQMRHPELTIYNCGVCGYGTDQEYLLLQKIFDQYRPKLVFLVINFNDSEDNSCNFLDGSYKPYYVLEGGNADHELLGGPFDAPYYFLELGKLKLRGVPVPKSSEIFFAEHKVLSRFHFALLLGRTYCQLALPPLVKNFHPPSTAIFLEMRDYVAKRGASFAVGLEFHHPGLEKFFLDAGVPCVDLLTTDPTHWYAGFGQHWTPEGHAFVAQKIDDFLRSGGIANLK
jgi:hypothetical protein